ncbi:S-layer protein [Candidatus Woesearchaeota archaeon]|nr:S-layer protein [Candidatus Woesearchaeota archaeon]
MFAVDKRADGVYSLPACEVDAKNAGSVSSELAIKIIKLLSSKPMYPVEIAKALKVHEQKIYYHIRNLHSAGIVKVVRQETRQGAVAKFYAVEKPAVVIKFRELEPTQIQLKSDSEFLHPFIDNGKLSALIIVGSPDPHGPDKARSRDGYYGMDLALFLGTFLNYVPKLYVKLDTEVQEQELKGNHLILIGGPIVNKVTGAVNQKLPIRFDKAENWSIRSTVSDSVYPSDESGIIVKAKSPFNSEKSVLVVAGKRYSGTRAAIVAFLKHFKEISAGNVRNKKIAAKVVEGVDLDSDGIIDDAEVRE